MVMKDSQRRAMWAKIKTGIQLGENPEGDSNYSKFVDDRTSEGFRGKIVAMKPDRKEAVIKSFHNSFEKKGVKSGGLYIVKEMKEGQYPIVIKKTSFLPKTWIHL